MELIHGSETSAYYILTPGKYPKEHIQYSNHGESLKSTNLKLFLRLSSCASVGEKRKTLIIIQGDAFINTA